MRSMSRYSKNGQVAKCGSVDSKYFSNLDKFEEDINSKLESTRKFKGIKRRVWNLGGLI